MQIRQLTTSIVCAAIVAGLTAASGGFPASGRRAPIPGIHKIRHVVVIMQENRSFDNYFGTYPGADGIPMKNGVPTVCLPDVRPRPCVRPYPDHADINTDSPHASAVARRDIDGGRMDGFVRRARVVQPRLYGSQDRQVSGARERSDDRRRRIPHRERPPELLDLRARLRAAGPHVRADAVVEPSVAPLHGLRVGGGMHPTQHPNSCRNASDLLTGPQMPRYGNPFEPSRTADLRVDRPDYLLHRAHVSWRYYVTSGTNRTVPTAASRAHGCRRMPGRRASGIRSRTSTRAKDNQLGDIQPLQDFYSGEGRLAPERDVDRARLKT